MHRGRLLLAARAPLGCLIAGTQQAENDELDGNTVSKAEDGHRGQNHHRHDRKADILEC